jgi:hypothetical protein
MVVCESFGRIKTVACALAGMRRRRMITSPEIEFGNMLVKLFDIAARAMNIHAASSRQLAAVLWEPVRLAYEQAGQPYGLLDEDMKRWWRDQWPNAAREGTEMGE